MFSSTKVLPVDLFSFWQKNRIFVEENKRLLKDGNDIPIVVGVCKKNKQRMTKNGS